MVLTPPDSFDRVRDMDHSRLCTSLPVLLLLASFPFCTSGLFLFRCLSCLVLCDADGLTLVLASKLLLAVINILPWILAFLYDALLYLGRMVWHEIPVFGGRARGENRPRAPSLRQRAGRRMSFVELVTGTTGASGGGAAPSTPTRATTRQERGHEKNLSRTSIPEEQEPEQEQEENT